MILILPKRARDGFRVVWYTLKTSYTWGVVERSAVFHTNTPAQRLLWADPFYRGKKIPPFRFQWAIYENGKINGRCDGWNGLVRYGFRDAYPTREAARNELLKRARDLIAYHERELGHLRQVVLEGTGKSGGEGGVA